uniref:Uncharaterized LOC112694756 homolog n=1 Tax=Geotrypetes seraphini TaxID=260995 RepID=A0A6P8QWN6_GEOSA|nr:uncharaterized LOC112694756 homolog [Geotrypetes seraphini]XP_033800231.1 uncharaterized LOC112694756 homolog [Geotrypetes seraphini]XP_033800232.1 uncharaterized LOC112694756 homolog [Geotrypetes seraphini]XP_033800233.1 uncharaterized LOC112694756 homolog [Geotrypetes seraphini]
MAPLTFPPSSVPLQGSISGLMLPLPAIVLLAVTAYLLFLLLVISFRQCLLARGFCADCCSWGKASQLGLCDCCLTCAESCDCRVPSMTRCLDSCCPRGTTCDPGSCLTSRCCPLCDFACAYQPPDCETINCICFEVRLR